MSNIKIPWAKPDIGNEELLEIKKSFKSNWLTQGPKVKMFEKKLAKYFGAKYAVAVSNGTAALDIAHKAIGIKQGDEIIMPAISYFSTASMISYQKAIPVFVDIKEDDINIDASKIEKAITKKTKAISFIDYGGNPADFPEIKKIAKKYSLKIIQDGAQSIGGKRFKKPIGALGDISTTSFHMAKILSTVEGGMILTNNKKYYKEILIRRSHGEKKAGDYIHNVLAQNARMTDIQASIGLAQYRKLNFFLRSRRKVANTYNNYFKDIKNVTLPSLKKNCDNAYFFYPILINNRDKVAQKLKDEYGIDTRVAYKMPLYNQPLYKKKLEKFRKTNCPISEKVSKKILNLPIYPSLKNNEIKYIVKSISKII